MTISFPSVALATRKSMQANKGKDTKPEMIVRRLVHGMGYRYRLHRKDLPGRPDLVFGPRKKVIFVHGCFWHSHDDGLCRKASIPRTRAEFWSEKFEANKVRDSANERAMQALGWDILIVWECWLSDPERVGSVMRTFLGQKADG